jgi:hypothetical protein
MYSIKEQYLKITDGNPQSIVKLLVIIPFLFLDFLLNKNSKIGCIIIWGGALYLLFYIKK